MFDRDSPFRLDAILLLVWLALAAVSVVFAVHRDLSLARASFVEDVETIFDRVNNQVRLSEAVMDGFTAALETASHHDVSLAGEYARSVLKRYPMVYAIEVVRRVPHAALDSLGSIRTHPPVEGFWVKTFGYESDRKWRAVPEKRYYYPIVFLEPQLPAALDVIGLDVDSVDLLRQALRDASQRDAAVASAPFALVEGPTAIAAFAPVGRPDRADEPHPYRFERFAEMIIKADALLGPVNQPIAGLSVSLYLGGFGDPAATHEMLRRGDSEVESRWPFPRLEVQRRVEALGRTFIVRGVKQTGWSDVNRSQLTLIAFLSIVTFGLLLLFSRLHHRRELERLRREERLFDMANFDAVTGLPNRYLCTDRLLREIELARRNTQRFAVLFADLDDFKSVNDRYGHSTGDLVLKAAAERFIRCVRSSDWVARLAGDEFLIALASPSDADVAARVRAKIVESFSRPVDAGEVSVAVRVSVGTAVYPDDGADMESLLKASDETMYRVKSERRRLPRGALTSVR